jgi:hypothetical protein
MVLFRQAMVMTPGRQPTGPGHLGPGPAGCPVPYLRQGFDMMLRKLLKSWWVAPPPPKTR